MRPHAVCAGYVMLTHYSRKYHNVSISSDMFGCLSLTSWKVVSRSAEVLTHKNDISGWSVVSIQQTYWWLLKFTSPLTSNETEVVVVVVVLSVFLYKLFHLQPECPSAQTDWRININSLSSPISPNSCFTLEFWWNVYLTGKKNKLRVYYLSWLRNKILHNDPEVEKKQGWTTVGDLEGCVHYKVGRFRPVFVPLRERRRTPGLIYLGIHLFR